MEVAITLLSSSTEVGWVKCVLLSMRENCPGNINLLFTCLCIWWQTAQSEEFINLDLTYHKFE